ncbi:MAG: C40 family peptidase [Parcubacteria group bacterium]|nr:C40 family peptidase [Parcubacteria group bacterium]
MIKKISFFIFPLLFLFLFSPLTTSAAGLVSCTELTCSLCDLLVLVNTIYLWILGISALLASGLITFAGIQMIVNSANPGKSIQARGLLIQTLIALAIVFGSWLIVSEVLRAVTGAPREDFFTFSCKSQAPKFADNPIKDVGVRSRQDNSESVTNEGPETPGDATVGSGGTADGKTIAQKAIEVKNKLPGDLDCSAYAQYVLKQVGINAPRTADWQAGNPEAYKGGKMTPILGAGPNNTIGPANNGTPYSTDSSKGKGTKLDMSKLQPGDLVFFGHTTRTTTADNTGSNGITHVGIYIGNGQMIHDAAGRGTKTVPLNTDYWREKFYGAVRVSEQ